MSSLRVKRTVCIGGDRIDVAIEDLFWTSLEEIAATQGTTTSSLIAWIDRGRHGAKLSSAIRVYVVDHFREQAEALNDLDVDLTTAPMRPPVVPSRPRWLN